MCEVAVSSHGQRVIAEVTNSVKCPPGRAHVYGVFPPGQSQASQAEAGTSDHLTLDPGQTGTVEVVVRQARLLPRAVEIVGRVEAEGISVRTVAASASIAPAIPPLVSVLAACALLISLVRWTAVVIGGADADRPHQSPSSVGPKPSLPTRAADLDAPALPDDFAFAVRPVETEGSCAENATDQVRALLSQAGCSRLLRFVADTSVNGRKVLVSAARFYVGEEAQHVVDILNTADTGDMNSLLAEQKYPGLPYGFDGDSPFTSRNTQSPSRTATAYVVAVKAMWTNGETTRADRAALLPTCMQIAATL